MSCATADPIAAPPAPVRLTEAERAKALAGIEGLIRKAVINSALPHTEWDDAVGEVTMRIWEASARFDASGSAKFSTWATVVARNVLNEYRTQLARANNPGGCPVRRMKDDDRIADDEPDDDEDGDEHAYALAGAVRRQLAGPALDSLTPGYRRIVEQVVIGRLTLAQIADQTGTPEKVLRINLQAALGQLAKAGHVPTGMAAALGFNVRDLAERVTPGAKGRKLKARRELIAEALAAGLSEREIIEQLGEPEGTVQRDLKLLGNGCRRPRDGSGVTGSRGRAAIQRAKLQGKALELSARGMKREDIGAELGIGIRQVYKLLQNADGKGAGHARD